MAKEGFTQDTLKKRYPDVYKAMMEAKKEQVPQGHYNTYLNFFRNYRAANNQPRKVSLQAVLEYLEASGKNFSITIK
jgi:hypothetical protein